MLQCWNDHKSQVNMAGKVCVCVYTRTKERKPHKEAFNKEEPKTNAQEIWSCRRKENDSLHCSVRCRRSGCEDELSCSNKNYHHHTHFIPQTANNVYSINTDTFNQSWMSQSCATMGISTQLKHYLSLHLQGYFLTRIWCKQTSFVLITGCSQGCVAVMITGS